MRGFRIKGRTHKIAGAFAATAAAALITAAATIPGIRSTDESVFVENLAPGERESLVYVWTRDADGQDTDYLVTVDVDPESDSYGQIIAKTPTGSAGNETHHFGYTADASRIFGGGLFSNKLFIYDVASSPRDPELINTVDLDATGYSGPHTLYAVPDGVLLAMLGSVGGGGPGALVKVDDSGDLIDAWPVVHEGNELYMYDVGIKPGINRMITSSWAHPHHVKLKGGSPPQNTGNEVVVWNWQNKEILQVVELDGAPLEVRWLHGPDATGGFINCAYGGTVWYWQDADGDGRFAFRRVITLPTGSAPADMRISYDNKFLYVSLFGGGEVRQYDVTDPLKPELVDTVELPHPNMMRISPDSERLYVTNSLLSTMDPDTNFGMWLFYVGPDGMRVEPEFHPDFESFETGQAGPHDMLFR